MRLIDELFNLEGRIALVTGGSSGIGRAMAFHLARAGAAVVHAALPREEEALKEAVSEAKSLGVRAAYVSCDVSHLEELPGMVERASSFFGSPDILVNAAGVNLREPWEKVSPESWNKTITINLTAPFFLARLLVPSMR
ncbi:MAG: SDR family NAD(P)-dependent oxidoreductase, partial [Desulfobacterales bacterium]